MKEMEKIGEAILGKVRAEAETIIKEAKDKAEKEIEQAKRQQVAKMEEEKGKILEEAREEAVRIAAQASVKARQESSKAKADVINEMLSRVKKELSGISGDKSLLMGLIKEATDVLGIDKGRVYVSPKDISTVQKLLEKDRKLASKIVEIREYDCLGGVIVEDIDGRTRIDNTYETRLEMLLPRLLPEISKELF
ncbi:V-type proton ATPase subunit E [subsurface metagenome]|jgi:V/A-type H+-transporting ATPase subunit E